MLMKKELEFNRLSKIFKALSDENRLKILSTIYESKTKDDFDAPYDAACVKNLAKCVNLTVPTVSYHIKELMNAGLIHVEKKGKWVYCHIDKESYVEIVDFLKNFKENGLGGNK